MNGRSELSRLETKCTIRNAINKAEVIYAYYA